MRNPVVVAVAALALAACSFEPAAAQTADTIFVGDHIVTMDPDRPAVDAVAIRDGVITAAGERGAILAGRGEETRVVELGERALLPGFIDTHGHLLAVGRGLDTLSLHSPPVGDVTDVDGLVRKIRGGSPSGTFRPARWCSGRATTILCWPSAAIRRATISIAPRPATGSC